ncbi:MAG TPA: hypothetical protein VN455_09080 [Methanotrichaceae archaeon]|nr:hypothetical protein [Methanotrichaceae archaeon]
MKSIRSTYYVTGLAFFILSSACLAQSSVPLDWEEHVDPLGFKISHPADWSVDTPGKELIKVSSPDGSAFVMVYPFVLDRAVTSKEYLEAVPNAFPTVFPGAEVAVSSEQRHLERPDGMSATMTYQSGGIQGLARLLCVIDNRSGMLFAIAAPAQKFSQMNGTLINIVSTFSFTEPGMNASRDEVSRNSGMSHNNEMDLSNGMSQKIQYIQWHDPQSGAFSLDVPSGWNVDGGLAEMGANDLRLGVEIDSPDSKVGIMYGDRDIPKYISARGSYESPSLVEGAVQSDQYGMYLLSKHYMTGEEYARAYIEYLLGRYSISGFNFTGSEDRQDISGSINEVYSRYGLPMRASAGEAAFTLQVGDERYQGYCLAVTEWSGTGTDYCLWQVSQLIGYIAPDSREMQARSVLDRAVNSFKLNRTWAEARAGQAGSIGQNGAQMTSAVPYPGQALNSPYPSVPTMDGGLSGQTGPGTMPSYAGSSINAGSEVSDIIMETYNSREKTMDDLSHKWSNTILGTTDVQDPGTGDVYNVESGSNYYWKDNSGSVWGTQTADSPSPSIDFTPLEEVSTSSET